MSRLNEINDMLKEYGVDPITNKLNETQVYKLKKATVLNESVTDEKLNTIYKLIREALTLIEPEKVMSKEQKIKELEQMYETYVSKHGENEKANMLLNRVHEMKRQMVAERIQETITITLNESAQEAEAIMAAKGMLDDIIGFQSKIGDIQNKYMDGFLGKVTDAYGSDKADMVRTKLNESLQSLMDAVRDTKEGMSEIVDILSGNSDGSEDDMIDDVDGEDMEDFEDDSEATDGDDLGELGDLDGSESDSDSEGDDLLSGLDDTESKDDMATDFKRKGE